MGLFDNYERKMQTIINFAEKCIFSRRIELNKHPSVSKFLLNYSLKYGLKLLYGAHELSHLFNP